jgi:hypothetical protein
LCGSAERTIPPEPQDIRYAGKKQEKSNEAYQKDVHACCNDFCGQ